VSEPGIDEDEGGFEEPSAPAWMATFGDLMSLLLTFFILLLSFSSMNQKKFSDVAGSVRNAFGIQYIRPGRIEALSDSLISLADKEGSPYLRVIDVPSRFPEKRQRLLRRLKMSVAGQKLERIVEVDDSPRGVVVRVPGSMLFDASSTSLRPESLVFLHEIAELVKKNPGEVAIEGHTDATGGSSSVANWRISSARAVAALQYLVQVGHVDPHRLRATGFADTRPVAPNDSEEHRRANRRVEFVFLQSPTSDVLGPVPETLRKGHREAAVPDAAVSTAASIGRQDLPTPISP